MLPFDTLDDVVLRDEANVYDLYDVVLGAPMAQDDVVGSCMTGAITPSYQYQIGNHKWGKTLVEYPEHFETWQVRSSPKGRIGMPLEMDEFREVLVLVRNTQTKKAQITTIKLWTLPGILRRIDHTKTKYARGAVTYGAVGVSCHGIGLFNQRAQKEYLLSRNCDCHSVLSSISTLMDEKQSHIVRIEASPLPHMVVAAHLAGFVMPDTPMMRNCEERMKETDYNSAYQLNLRKFTTTMNKLVPADAQPGPQLSIAYIFSGQCIFEQAGFIALLDEMASPLYEDAIADDRHQPCSIALMLAMAVRIACNPTRWGMPALVGDDAYAAKTVGMLFDAIQPSVLRGLFEERVGEQTYAIDVAITHAFESMKEVVSKLESGKLTVSGTPLGLEAAQVEARYRKTMHHLFCAGVAVCEDTCGLPPNTQNEESEEESQKESHASWYTDAANASMAQSAYASGLGQVADLYPRHRTSTRGRRQSALLRVLQNVEEWICTSNYQGTRLTQHAAAPANDLVENVRADDLQAADAAAPADAPATAPAAAPAPVSSANTKLPTSNRSCTLRSTSLSRLGTPARKKKSAKPTPVASSTTTDAKLASNGRRRLSNEAHCVDKAVASLLKSNPALDRDQTAFLLHASVKGKALDEASGVMNDLLQVGAVFGMGQYFDAQTYAVGPNGMMQCATCPRALNVVQSVAFAGAFGKCVRCGHPRCLHCVSEDIDLVAANKAEAELLTEPTAVDLRGCKMCCTER